MNTRDILKKGSACLSALPGRTVDLFALPKPASASAAAETSKLISKLSPLLGNLLELSIVEHLNKQEAFQSLGEWRRQDPGFPDVIFAGGPAPAPGFEIKTWLPLATEMTARFRNSQNLLRHGETHVCILAWLPEQLVFGKPKIIDLCVVPGLALAQARDGHYHNPPDYLVLEPEDTEDRTRNLQQSNANGHKWQGTPAQIAEASALVGQWGADARTYQPAPEYQARLRELVQRYPYRLDTNFAKIDRIGHGAIEDFKSRVLRSVQHGLTIQQWTRLLRAEDARLLDALTEKFGIKEGGSGPTPR